MGYQENRYCAFVVQPCHFRGPNELCTTTFVRLDAALVEVERQRRIFKPIIILTGDVPYQPGGPTLAALMRSYLEHNGFAGPILFAEGGTGTFTEPRLVTRLVLRLQARFPGLDQMIVVASEWQLFAGMPFWEREASKYALGLDYRWVPGTGGWRTRLLYRAYGLFLRAALGSGLWARIEPRLYCLLYRHRYTGGFRMNACQ
ncbi:MAG: hypothetical protein A3A44_01750 [Candidatus Sungbacteria bacterium RIFCSPLOWO2_01_FULL_60_25]|uniref:DUF218 domain-containing protein n=1 Tax=Candidatus Sungbacteria bacterium RIFCSPLOWO2_01_FULL_60_25 TaxID=1802281 RepID=A0A1G2LD69_9BACT|nr:MAG: hypothetical protein A3A44_01750 [Candidatus Sungbacteria bacterium RIFCSPLOWO2_01_FULL_60_25]